MAILYPEGKISIFADVTIDLKNVFEKDSLSTQESQL